MTDKGKSSKSVAQQTRLRKYWIGCNWKCTGNISFIKDSLKNMFNDFEYEQSHLGTLKIDEFCRFNDSSRLATFATCLSNYQRRDSNWCLKRFSDRRRSFHRWNRRRSSKWLPNQKRACWTTRASQFFQWISGNNYQEGITGKRMFLKLSLLCWWDISTKRCWANRRSIINVVGGFEGFATGLESDNYRLWTALGHGNRHYRQCRPDIRVMRFLAIMGKSECVIWGSWSSKNSLRWTCYWDQRWKPNKTARFGWLCFRQHFYEAQFQKHFWPRVETCWKWKVGMKCLIRLN